MATIRRHVARIPVIVSLLFLVRIVDAAPCDAIAPIDSGFGSAGPFTVAVDSFPAPQWQRRYVRLYRPVEDTSPRPIIYLAHRYDLSDDQQYSGLITHLVSRGFAVIDPPIRPITFTRKQLSKYNMAYVGFEEATRRYSGRLDTTRIGFIGHGFGGGMLPALARRLLKNNWGSQGAFMFIMAPWFAYGVDQRQLQTFPPHVKLLVQVYADDNINDPRIALDLFRTIGLPASEKEFQIVYGDRRGDCQLRADNDVPLGSATDTGSVNNLDFYAVYRMADALAAYSFSGDPDAKKVALGEGRPRELSMGVWPDGLPVRRMIATDSPAVYLPGGVFVNSWKNPLNPRMESSSFKKARKLYLSHQGKKFVSVSAFGRNKLQALGPGKDEEESFDVFANPIDSGYGAEGKDSVVTDSIPSPLYKDAFVYLMRPAKARTPLPMVMLIHGYSGSEPALMQPLLDHIASRGYAVIYSPYPMLPVVSNATVVLDKYRTVFAGIEAAVEKFHPLLDTSRIGFFGQSFGGGAVPALAWKALKEKGWGSQAAFMFISAPWYSFDISPTQLASFPQHVKLITLIYDDDVTNDHQMAVDLFNHIKLPEASKDFITMYSDSMEALVMHANHFVPYGPNHMYGEQNLLDYYGLYKLLDALADYSFTGSKEAGAVALGNGSPRQRFMGEWTAEDPITELEVTDHPRAHHSQLRYLFAWDNPLNPRRGK